MKTYPTNTDCDISIPVKSEEIGGILNIPDAAKALVIFAHGSGSSRLSPRNQVTAKYLQKNGFATLLFDLLTPSEDIVDDATREFRFNIPLLAERLIHVTDWIIVAAGLQSFALGYFGASTGAGAALMAAANLKDDLKAQLKAVVSRGGRPDLAGESLQRVEAATLLIVGELDPQVIELNELAMRSLHCENELVIVPGATHLFEEPGKLDEITRLSTEWFRKCLLSSRGLTA